MLDRLLNGALWLTVMTLITATAGAALILSYRGIFTLCANQYRNGATLLGTGAILGLACYLLSRHGNDLMDR
jgi:hypothetical protein